MNTTTRLLVAGVAVLLAAPPAYSQNRDMLRLNADVLQLQQQVKQLQLSMDEKTAVLVGLVEEIADQVNSIQTNLAAVSESVESVKSSNENTVGDLRVLVGNLEENVGHVNEGLSSIRTQINAVAQQLNTQSSTQQLDRPEDHLRTATVDQLSGNYDLAIDSYREFLTNYPNHARAPEAQLAIGDAFFSQRKFDQALIEYDLFLQKYPTDDRTRSALYKKGLAHAELDQTPMAQAALQRVVKEFPGTVEATNAQLKIRELTTPRRR